MFGVRQKASGRLTNIWKKVLWSDETKMELFGHQGKRCLAQNPTPLITPRTFPQPPQWSMVVAASCCGNVFDQQGNWSELNQWWMALNTGKLLRETSSAKLIETSKRLAAVIAANGGSTKYWLLGGVNSYAQDFSFFVLFVLFHIFKVVGMLCKSNDTSSPQKLIFNSRLKVQHNRRNAKGGWILSQGAVCSRRTWTP
jgi:hypothetical protein